MWTGAQQLVEQGRVEGRLEGRVEGRLEGRAEGRLEGQAELLLVLLRTRFGELTPEVVTRVRSADSARLEAWATRSLSATRIGDLFGAP